MKTIFTLLILAATTAHAAPNWCEYVFKTDFEKNYDNNQGMDGRVSVAFAAKTKVVYTIGGKSYPLETIVDKHVDIELQPNATAKALAFDKIHGGRHAQETVEQFLNIAPDLRVATIRSYDYLNQNRADDVIYDVNRGVGFKNQNGNGRRVEFYDRANNELLNALFRVKTIRPFEIKDYVQLNRDISTARRDVTYSKAQLSPEILDTLIGEYVFVQQTKKVSIGGFLFAARITDQGTRLALRILDSGNQIRLLEYDLAATDLRGIFISNRSAWAESVEKEGALVGADLPLNPQESNTIAMQRLDLSKPVFLAYAGAWKLEMSKGTLVLPTQVDEVLAMLDNRPLFVTLKTDQGDIRINAINVYRVYGTQK